MPFLKPREFKIISVVFAGVLYWTLNLGSSYLIDDLGGFIIFLQLLIMYTIATVSQKFLIKIRLDNLWLFLFYLIVVIIDDVLNGILYSVLNEGPFKGIDFWTFHIQGMFSIAGLFFVFGIFARYNLTTNNPKRREPIDDVIDNVPFDSAQDDKED